MKTIRLDNSQRIRWRQNRYALLDSETGNFVRYATIQEAYQKADADARNLKVKVKDKGRILNFRPDRERLKEELIRTHGTSVRVVGSNGLQLFVSRVFVPTLVPEDKRVAPHPNRCKCSEWEGRPDGKHHPHCPLNAIAPPEHRSDLQDIELTGELIEEVGTSDTIAPKAEEAPSKETPSEETVPREDPHDTEPPPPIAHAVPSPSVIEFSDIPPSPGDCPNKCFQWRMPMGQDRELDQHHPACEFEAPWREHSNGELPSFIYTLSGTLMRRASLDEKAEAQRNLELRGSPTIQLGSEEFLVMTETP